MPRGGGIAGNVATAGATVGGRIEQDAETRHGLTDIVSRAAGEESLVLAEVRQPTDNNLAMGGLVKAGMYIHNDIESIADLTVSRVDLIDNFESERTAEI